MAIETIKFESNYVFQNLNLVDSHFRRKVLYTTQDTTTPYVNPGYIKSLPSAL